MRSVAFALAVVAAFPSAAVPQNGKGRLAFESIAGAEFRFDGVIGRRMEVNARNWLLRAPTANPGMLAMFELRDRQPAPNLVPWAGEFVGKYLISAIQALRMTDDPELEKTVRAVISRLIASQADDGYLGPFPKNTRLMANWDLWGHYHCMLALLMWHDRTGEEQALTVCRKAADLVCKTFLDAGRRVVSVGSDEMNLAIIHALGGLYRKTGEKRYLAMMREIEKDWERAGDYFRTGLAGVEFHRIPRPRWESLHDLQGLVELYRIIGDERYRRAFLNHWHSIRRWDRHNNGSFSSGEQATGNPYRSDAIETCCTVAWMAITADALQLTGDPCCADELELSTFNGILAAQHPSGAWCTYNTPMSGARDASHHTIVFQARSGTPDLNCCSVNGPRGLGMLSEWAILGQDGGVAVNFYGPMRASWKLPDGTAVTLEQITKYPLDGNVRIIVRPEKPVQFPLRLRIPAWSADTKLVAPEGPVSVAPGTYAEIRRQWKSGDEISVHLDMRLRYESGDGDAFGRISVYRGPLLLAYDQRLNEFDEAELPVLEPTLLGGARVAFPEWNGDGERAGVFTPWVVAEITVPPSPNGPPSDGTKPKDRVLRLCDFASAGSMGSRYVSWLPAVKIAPPPPTPALPAEGASVPPGPVIFAWRKPLAFDRARTHTVVIADSPDMKVPLLEAAGGSGSRFVLPADQAGRLKPGADYYWKLVARNEVGVSESLPPAKRFRIEPSLRPIGPEELSEFGEGPGGVVVAADLAGDPNPSYGKLVHAHGHQPAAGPDGKPNSAVQLDGKKGMLTYGLRAFPSRDYTVAVWVAHEQPDTQLGQIFSAWDHVMDDPLRLCIVGGKLHARVETGTAYSTEGVPVDPGRWYHVAAVKAGSRLTLYLDGKAVAATQIPEDVYSTARDFALGGNPHFTGLSEHLACRLARFRLLMRAMTPEEVAALHQKESAAWK